MSGHKPFGNSSVSISLERTKHGTCDACVSTFDDDDSLDLHKSLLTGRAMTQWWDRSEDAGPTSRTAERFAIDLPTLECLAASDGEVKIVVLNVSYVFIILST